jgi:hypothetical protein
VAIHNLKTTGVEKVLTDASWVGVGLWTSFQGIQREGA